jgi:hypothetical protein
MVPALPGSQAPPRQPGHVSLLDCSTVRCAATSFQLALTPPPPPLPPAVAPPLSSAPSTVWPPQPAAGARCSPSAEGPNADVAAGAAR